MLVFEIAGSVALSSGSSYLHNRRQIAIHSVECDGTEKRIFDCVAGNERNSTCGRYQDAWVRCQGMSH